MLKKRTILLASICIQVCAQSIGAAYATQAVGTAASTYECLFQSPDDGLRVELNLTNNVAAFRESLSSKWEILGLESDTLAVPSDPNSRQLIFTHSRLGSLGSHTRIAFFPEKSKALLPGWSPGWVVYSSGGPIPWNKGFSCRPVSPNRLESGIE